MREEVKEGRTKRGRKGESDGEGEGRKGGDEGRKKKERKEGR